MAGAKRRLAYERAKKTGTPLEAWVIRHTSNWDRPVISTEQIIEELDLSADEVLDQLLDSEIIDHMEVEETFVFW